MGEVPTVRFVRHTLDATIVVGALHFQLEELIRQWGVFGLKRVTVTVARLSII